MDKKDFKAEVTLKAVLEQADRVAIEPRTHEDAFGILYDVNMKLRNQFPKSYFLDDVFDEAIVAVDCITESIMYDWKQVGYLCSRSRSSDDILFYASHLIHWINELTAEELQGKVRPTIIMLTTQLEYWSKRLYHQDFLSPAQISKKKKKKIKVEEPPTEFDYYNSDLPEDDILTEMAEAALEWELSQLEVSNPACPEDNSVAESRI